MTIEIPTWLLWAVLNLSALLALAWCVRRHVARLRAEHKEKLAGALAMVLDLQAQLDSHASLWLVGRHVRGNHWDVQGIFSSRELAVAACKNVRYFLFVLDLDRELPEESAVPFKLEYPKEVG